jgi:hypothetical protein
LGHAKSPLEAAPFQHGGDRNGFMRESSTRRFALAR